MPSSMPSMYWSGNSSALLLRSAIQIAWPAATTHSTVMHRMLIDDGEKNEASIVSAVRVLRERYSTLRSHTGACWLTVKSTQHRRLSHHEYGLVAYAGSRPVAGSKWLALSDRHLALGRHDSRVAVT